jgi:hypothetical protein
MFGLIDEQRGLDELNGVKNPFSRKTLEISGTYFIIRGWAIDIAGKAPVAAVELVVDGRPVAIPYGIDRHDVADAEKNKVCRHCGFKATVPAPPPGTYTVTLRGW